jgi:hypothetical protein
MAEQPHEPVRKSKASAEDNHSDERDDFTRAALYTPRRYEQPIEDDDDPVMPSPDATVNTKI